MLKSAPEERWYQFQRMGRHAEMFSMPDAETGTLNWPRRSVWHSGNSPWWNPVNNFPRNKTIESQYKVGHTTIYLEKYRGLSTYYESHHVALRIYLWQWSRPNHANMAYIIILPWAAQTSNQTKSLMWCFCGSLTTMTQLSNTLSRNLAIIHHCYWERNVCLNTKNYNALVSN